MPNGFASRHAAAGVCLIGLLAIGRPGPAGAEGEQAVLDPVLDPVIDLLLSVEIVGRPAISPDGGRVAYVVERHDPTRDRMVQDIWLTEVGSRSSRRLTFTDEDESEVAWHPTADAITFLSDRHDPEKMEAQLWMLPMTGGEAWRLTDVRGGIEDYAWSADGARIAAVVMDPDPFEPPDEDARITTAPPIVIDRFAFKTDGEGYLTRGQRIYLLDGETGEGEALALRGHEPGSPSFSPDGRYLAYVAKGAEEPDRTEAYDVYLLDLASERPPQALAPSPMNDCGPDLVMRPRWSPDSRHIACISAHPDRDSLYAQSEIKILDVESGESRVPTESLDLNVYEPRFSPDGRRVLFTVERDMTVELASIPLRGGEARTELAGPLTVDGYDVGPRGRVVARLGKIDRPAELYTVGSGKAVQLTTHNDALLAERPWQGAEAIRFESPDGTEVHGLLMRPVGAREGRRYPTVLWLHGGPTSQFAYEPRREPQLFAAHGYAVLLINPRGSTGRGVEYSRGIYAAWGSVDVADVLAGVDYAVEAGVADPDRLVVGGWSYGGMLTNYVIASDQRFKAAVSGASISNVWAGFGTDMYIRDYLSELGTPWDDPEAWNRVSYPFLHADRISTPTLFLVGENDYNVPLLATEQMYQALKVLRVPTRMVIYPGQSHSFDVPSYDADAWRRYLAWFDEYLPD
jgi:dipeptidyl aminopeptidase/acylaminoacyl peptidase